MKIVLTGGGTMGSVTPLLAAAEQLQQHGQTLVFVGTTTGPEKEAVQSLHIPFRSITATKLRRYISFYHFLVPFQLIAGIWQSFWLLRKEKPDVVVSAGGFVAVPLVWMAKLLHIPSIIHQQDLQPGLANKLMLPLATHVTVAFEESLNDFPQATWIGNPVRDMTPTTNEFQIDTSVPTVLIIGGGTGAQALNELVTTSLCEYANVIHVTGRFREGKMETITHSRYHKRVFLGEELKEAIHKATIVVSRAGLGAITELATLGKPSIIIPMPDSHQEKNAQMLAEHDAAIIEDQRVLTPQKFIDIITSLLENTEKQKRLSENIQKLFPKKSTERFVEMIEKVRRLEG